MEQKNWYDASGKERSQGLIIEEGTGRNVAVSYDVADAKLIANAPALLKVLTALLEDVEFAQPKIEGGLIGNRQIRKAREIVDSLSTQ